MIDLKERRVGVLGYGQEGRAVIEYLLRHGTKHKPVLFDKRPWDKFRAEEQDSITRAGLDKVLGADYLEHLGKVEVLFRSPGNWRLAPQILAAEKAGLVVTSQVKWFFEHCPGPIIGVTGTKGKGTTASLIAHILQKRQAILTGNVGKIQPLEILDALTPANIIVYELSSFQLQDLEQSPHIGVVLMVTEDHLDVHASVDEYRAAKQAITKYQASEDFAIINDDYVASQAIGQLGEGQKYYFSRRHEVRQGAWVEGSNLIVKIPQVVAEPVSFDLSLVPLRGRHNWENAAAAVLACLCAGAGAEDISQLLPSFKGLPHRLEALPEQNGVKFYDDSISTVPDTAEAAVKSFDEPLTVILGGYDKGAKFGGLAKTIAETPNIKAVAAIGATAPAIISALEKAGYGQTLLHGYQNLRETMAAIKEIAAAGDVVLLSPACASFDWYPNYKERGNDFRRLAEQWDNL